MSEILTKEQKQHIAWKKWYDSDKGKAYREKKKASRPLKNDPQPTQDPQP